MGSDTRVSNLRLSVDRGRDMPIRLAIRDTYYPKCLFVPEYRNRTPSNWHSDLQQRLEHLSWDSSNQFDRFLKSFQRGSTFPSLRTLSITQARTCRSCRNTITSADREETDHHIKFWRCRYPQLTELKLGEVLFSVPSIMLHTLKHLTIRHKYMTSDELEMILTKGIQLEVLEITSILGVQEGIGSFESENAYTMPNLQRLVFDYIPEEIITTILYRSYAPRLQSLVVCNIKLAEESLIEYTGIDLLNHLSGAPTLSGAIIRLVSLVSSCDGLQC